MINGDLHMRTKNDNKINLGYVFVSKVYNI